MTTWARAGFTTQLRHDFFSFPPSDHWAQVDVWIPNLNPCPNPITPGTGFLPYFLRLANYNALGASSATSPIPSWRWHSIAGTAATGPSAGTTYTVGYHVHGSTFDWYVNGVLVLSEPLSGVSAFNFLILNFSAPACCCQAIYYTNVLVGTSQGAGDLFADDFSGGLDNWYVNSFALAYPPVVSLVSTPAVTACPTVSVSPTRGLPGDPITISGSGFTPSSPLTLYWTGFGTSIPVEDFAVTSDGAGAFTTMLNVPPGVAFDPFLGFTPTPDSIYVLDADMLLGCSTFTVCGTAKADGIMAGLDANDDDTNLPDPVVAFAGSVGDTNRDLIFDYIWHDGAHWVLWQDPSAADNAGTFPPPANHTMTATRISADGSSITDYPIDTGYQWIFGSSEANDEGLFNHDTCGFASVGRPVWSQISFFDSWNKPIYDARFASDGATLWVGIVTRETVLYPWLDNTDATGPNPGTLNQFLSLGAWTAGFTSFPTNAGTGRHIWNTQTDGPINQYQGQAFPVTDAGEEDTGYWSPPCVAMFAFDGSAFNRIGTIDAFYCPGITNGSGYGRDAILSNPQLAQTTQRGSLFSRASLAASPNSPGVCHVVWSEGGDWGRQGLAGADCRTLVWDSGPLNRSYRVNYTTWGPGGKLSDQDIFSSHVDRTNWWFPWDFATGTVFPTGYTWPDQAEFAGLLCHDLRNDNANGDALLFASWPQAFNLPTDQFGNPSPDAHGDTWDDWTLIFCDTVHVYDITSGSAVLKQSIGAGLLPNEAECDWAYPPQPASNQPDATPTVKASDCLFGVTQPFDRFNGHPITDYGPQDKAFGISLVYEDPLLDGTPVYLVHVPWVRRFPDRLNAGYGNYRMRAFYRVPADMGDGFDFLDGHRQLQFSVLNDGFRTGIQFFGSGDFFSDPDNIWVPSVVGPRFQGGAANGVWFDRVCRNRWLTLPEAETPGSFGGLSNTVHVGTANCPGFFYDPASDSISVAASVGTDPTTDLFVVTQLFICRGCANCRCGNGVHIAHRF